MQKRFTLFFFLFLILCLPAQSNSSHPFDRLEPMGEMPEYFKQILHKKNLSSAIHANDMKLLDEKFVFSLLMNGKILYGDPVSLYLSQLLDKILENKPQLRKEIRIFALKSEQVNAFATPMGTIFVNLGLLAHCANEAELAFIICHELAHYSNAHIEEKLKMNPDKITEIDDYLKYHSHSARNGIACR
jgi:predicted Zn-dependent protease